MAAIGHTLEADGVTKDPANHQYDSHDFFDALKAGNFPAVSYLKAPAYQDGHAGYSDPIDEQNFIVQVVTAVQASGDWATHGDRLRVRRLGRLVRPPGAPDREPVGQRGRRAQRRGRLQQRGAAERRGYRRLRCSGRRGRRGRPHPAQGRCGYGTRMPLLVVSPFAKKNYVDHTLTDQSSVLKFIEDNWLSGQRIQTGGSFDTIAGTIENMLSF